ALKNLNDSGCKISVEMSEDTTLVMSGEAYYF
ncbi:hypothetical protein MHK_002929, partial [Candidatus Magnetomorum sp. HK-1]